MTKKATMMVPPLALVGGASLTVNGVGSSERRQLMPAGAARKKLNFVSLVKRETTVTVPINLPLALVGGASLTVNGAGSSERRQLTPAGAARKKLNLFPVDGR
ncbi:MAG: hypothetical protein MPK75_09690 [Alphaproteobacteria bacterium]|nr:hypothetical protein [Alphaproteobacteria bacterium]